MGRTWPGSRWFDDRPSIERMARRQPARKELRQCSSSRIAKSVMSMVTLSPPDYRCYNAMVPVVLALALRANPESPHSGSRRTGSAESRVRRNSHINNQIRALTDGNARPCSMRNGHVAGSTCDELAQLRCDVDATMIAVRTQGGVNPNFTNGRLKRGFGPRFQGIAVKISND